jgi:GNAT superfamily N-acetyltransferase
MTAVGVEKVRDDAQIAAFTEMVWEFLDLMRERYPEMHKEIDEYVEHHQIAAALANFRDHYTPPTGEAFLGSGDGRALGICLLRKEADGGGELNRMYVRPEARGLGLGRRLAQAVIDEARAEGLHTLRLGALYRHKEAIPLYESLGFVRHYPEGELHADDARVVHMKLEL